MNIQIIVVSTPFNSLDVGLFEKQMSLSAVFYSFPKGNTSIVDASFGHINGINPLRNG